MSELHYRHLFGPVASRRLGRSLGIDVIPLKTCTYNCIYCQLGRTPQTTLERRAYVDPAVVLAEVNAFRSSGVAADYATFSGSGEPTLNSDLENLIAGVKKRLKVPVAVLTNGSLLWDAEIRADLREADVVCPTLDADDAGTFRRINRPHPGIDFDRMVEGLATFTREFRGEVWLEVFLVEGVNTAPAQIAGLRALIDRIGPRRVQLNTAVRPPAEPGVAAIGPDRLEELRAAFGPQAELIPSPRLLHETGRQSADLDRIRGAIARRPCTDRELAAALDMNLIEVQKTLELLSASGKVTVLRRGDNVFYAAK